ncbi:Mitochondrial Rho GTPase 2, partial [Tetrabaena socialis]
MSVRTVRIAVLGDPDTGKTSLISTAANDTFDARPVPTLPPTKLPLDFTPERVPILLTDTSAKPEDARTLDAVIRESDAVVVCFDPKKPATLDSVRNTWYPRVQKLNPDIPIILACCKADRLLDPASPCIRERVERVARDLPNVECCLNCSSKYNKMVHDVFYYALKAVLYPLQPLYDRTDRVMRQAAVRALKRVFIIFDQDKDGTLSDSEINSFQNACFGISLSAEELRGIKQVVRQQVPGGYTDTGLTLEGFLFLQGLFIERGRLETVWQVLRRFGYNDQLRLSDELLDRVNVNLPPDQ